MTALTTRLPGNSSRTSTQAITNPATELKAATTSEQIRVSFKAASASGWVAARQKAGKPLENALDRTAAIGSSDQQER